MTSFPELSSGHAELHNTSGQAIPVDLSLIENIVKLIENEQSIRFAHLEVVYVDEKEIVRINKEYLDRDYVTDIISFRYDEDDSDQQIEGTLYCCAHRIIEQSNELAVNNKEEFVRIIIHGLLHLCGYNDDTAEAKREMTRLEDHYLEELSLQ